MAEDKKEIAQMEDVEYYRTRPSCNLSWSILQGASVWKLRRHGEVHDRPLREVNEKHMKVSQSFGGDRVGAEEPLHPETADIGYVEAGSNIYALEQE
jgi:hypothetical protein